MRIDQLREEFDLRLRYSVFPLHPETPEQGQSLQELFGARMDVAAMLERLRSVAAELGLPFGARTHTYNSRRAQELGKWAEARGLGEPFHGAVYRAYFAEGRNIARPEELAAIAASVGLDGAEARQVLAEGRFAAAVDADWARARSLGVNAVPTLDCGGRRLVGFQPYEAFRRLAKG
ncbi:hypothetical protein DESUT3_00540 [Desulfuromonas versatilis]|uniref:DSBA-like thioredoxin domain-containing protein n=1 Tax=Desulfuromonas versatilis TaxID=2802975 RepID=A0ABN6DRY9_9BACT|nr:hypothetical protein DESUT3_00540 [Desulfuromonas versatilis]